MLSEEQKKEQRRLKHRQAQRKSHKKLMGTEKNKEKREERQKKARERFEKMLKAQAMDLLRQQVAQEGYPALKQAREQLFKCKQQCESLLKCVKNLVDELEFAEHEASYLCSFLSAMPAGDDKHKHDARRHAAYSWSVLDKIKVQKTRMQAESTLERVGKFMEELKTS